MSAPSSKVPRPEDADFADQLPQSTDSSPAPGSKLHDLKTIAEWLGISVKSVRRIIRRGELPYHRVGRGIRVSEQDCAEYLARSRHTIGKGNDK